MNRRTGGWRVRRVVRRGRPVRRGARSGRRPTAVRHRGARAVAPPAGTGMGASTTKNGRAGAKSEKKPGSSKKHPRAGAMEGRAAGRPRWTRIFRTTARSERKARTTIGVQHREQARASTSRTRRSKEAQGTRSLRSSVVVGIWGSVGAAAGAAASLVGGGFRSRDRYFERLAKTPCHGLR